MFGVPPGPFLHTAAPQHPGLTTSMNEGGRHQLINQLWLRTCGRWLGPRDNNGGCDGPTALHWDTKKHAPGLAGTEPLGANRGPRENSPHKSRFRPSQAIHFAKSGQISGESPDDNLDTEAI